LLVKSTDAPITAELADKGYTFWQMLIGLVPGSVGETSALCVALGAFILIASGVGSWRIMVSVVAGAAAMILLLNFLANDESSLWSLPIHYHLVMGSFAFGTVFMATDPVSASGTNPGKYIYGFLIGVLIIIIRIFNPAFKEGTLLAILFMNAFSPLIDHIVIQANIRRRLKYATK
jgi:Na+-transporting NADH:ubiquinone oxidoreductase subunit B